MLAGIDHNLFGARGQSAFLDAGITRGSACSGGRRPKSARARSRGMFERRACGRRNRELIFAAVMVVGANLGVPPRESFCARDGTAACKERVAALRRRFKLLDGVRLR